MTECVVQELPDDVETLKRIVLEQRETIRILTHNLEVMRKLAFEPHASRRPTSSFDPALFQGQLLFPEIVEAAERVADATAQRGEVEVRSTGKPRKGHGRRNKFPEHLPVIRTSFELPQSERTCACGERLSEIGEEISKELERLEICVVHEIARKKYACRKCPENVQTAPGPERVIDKGLLGVGFLAHLIVERFGNHLSYHRLEKKYASAGLDLSRVVLCESALRCAELLEPVYEGLKQAVLAARVPTGITLATSAVARLRPSSTAW